MIVFKNIEEHNIHASLRQAAELSHSPFEVRAKAVLISQLIAEAAAEILEEAEARSLGGNLWQTYLTLLLCGDDNILGRAAELGGDPSEPLRELALGEMAALCAVAVRAQEIAESEGDLSQFRFLSGYRPSRSHSFLIDDDSRAAVTSLAEKIFSAFGAADYKRALALLISFYKERGSGIFALNKAFKWREEAGGGRLVPISDLESLSLDSLVGYEEQKAELLANTELFLTGTTANNVLLFGDSGTGKSSSVKALLNQPGFVARGLRMIEVSKGQYKDLANVLNCVRGRNYRFVLFMDDLSFEEFEVEYKYLKAIIEGGLERKPDNAVIYATSNRRNLVREVWSDRAGTADDVRRWDAMQEKHSLADRFGVSIWYGSADRDCYLEMIRTMAASAELSLPWEELARMALRWEVGRGGYTGRTARQFIQYIKRGAMDERVM